ncbi:phosphoglycerate mutase-like protein [Nadsonia fulvescens var. elongata DSM 6958]|uniref:Phosphoglycerate mutase-like protein n=1 Tax=Nadsonia fulvescens var. elongata DSM 6958 TaxID=857566 RepID=A0A1E3PRJ1_9ASCO|nr:phosphoglycerate mutase-like protein [Nadsonia fulvescens var. elongata DSM 6958]
MKDNKQKNSFLPVAQQDEVDSLDLSSPTIIPFEVDDSQSTRKTRKKKLSNIFKKSRGSQQEYRRPFIKDPRLGRFLFLLLLPVLILFGIFLFITLSSPTSSKAAVPEVAPTGAIFHSGFQMKQNWGSISPYFDTGANFPGISLEAGSTESGFPQGYRLKQVHILHRHAERYPTPGTGGRMKKFAEKLYDSMDPEPLDPIKWIQSWNYTLGEDLLVSSGLSTEFTAGSEFWATHGRHLYNTTDKPDPLFYSPELNVYENGTRKPLPVIRTTSQSRIKTSAEAWAAGFFGIHSGQLSSETDREKLYDLIIMEEAPGLNNTLASYFGCPNAQNETYTPGYEMKREWIDTYLQDAAVRFQKLIPGFQNLTANDAYQAQEVCAFETAVFTRSKFCDLFTETEWRGYEYAADLDFYGSSSFGANKVGIAGGAGWLTELLARLKGELIHESKNGIDTKFTNNEDVFPLNQPFYLDMSHDSVLISVLSTLGFDFLQPKLTSHKMPAPRQFIVSRLTPFGARIFFEILESQISKPREEPDQQIRIKLNNRILPLNSLKYCSDNDLGLCKLSNFVKSVEWAIEQAEYGHSCFGDLNAS